VRQKTAKNSERRAKVVFLALEVVDQADAETRAVLPKVEDRSAVLLYEMIPCVEGVGESC
jgi:hypothetical protein